MALTTLNHAVQLLGIPHQSIARYLDRNKVTYQRAGKRSFLIDPDVLHQELTQLGYYQRRDAYRKQLKERKERAAAREQTSEKTL